MLGLAGLHRQMDPWGSSRNLMPPQMDAWPPSVMAGASSSLVLRRRAMAGWRRCLHYLHTHFHGQKSSAATMGSDGFLSPAPVSTAGLTDITSPQSRYQQGETRDEPSPSVSDGGLLFRSPTHGGAEGAP